MVGSGRFSSICLSPEVFLRMVLWLFDGLRWLVMWSLQVAIPLGAGSVGGATSRGLMQVSYYCSTSYLCRV